MRKRWMLVIAGIAIIAAVVIVASHCARTQPEIQTHVVKVRTDFSRSLMEMIEAGKYDKVAPEITAEITATHFPIESKGQQELTITLFRFKNFNRNEIDRDSVITEMEKRCYRPAKTEELLALGESCPDLQRQFAITALGSTFRGTGRFHRSRYFPCLCGGESQRLLWVRWSGSYWNEYDRFAAVHK